jgi:hypothetical protein
MGFRQMNLAIGKVFKIADQEIQNISKRLLDRPEIILRQRRPQADLERRTCLLLKELIGAPPMMGAGKKLH